MTSLEEKFYAIAAQELASKQVVVGLMSKAFSDCAGDEKKSMAVYIKLRVAQLTKQHQEQLKEAEKLSREQEIRKKAAERKAAEIKAQEEQEARIKESMSRLEKNNNTIGWSIMMLIVIFLIFVCMFAILVSVPRQ